MAQLSTSKQVAGTARPAPGGKTIRDPNRARQRSGGAWLTFLFLVWAVTLPLTAGATEAVMSEGWVEYENGKLSMGFKQTPVAIAVEALHAKTGMRVSLPTGARGKLLSVKVDPLPIEEAVYRLLRALGLENYALIYDENGHAQSLIVLKPEPGTSEPTSLTPSPPPAAPNVPAQMATSSGRPRPVLVDPPVIPEQTLHRFRERFPGR